VTRNNDVANTYLIIMFDIISNKVKEGRIDKQQLIQFRDLINELILEKQEKQR
jgi:hypothetical protein